MGGVLHVKRDKRLFREVTKIMCFLKSILIMETFLLTCNILPTEFGLPHDCYRFAHDNL
jgi:hypothetical protein